MKIDKELDYAPIYYCPKHAGIGNEDSQVCDFYDSPDGSDECDFRPTYYVIEKDDET